MSRVLTRPQVYVGGKDGVPVAPMSGLTSWGALKVTHRWPYGCWETSWDVRVRRFRRYPQLTAGQPVVVRYGATPVWAGTLTEPDWDTGTITAIGLARQGEETICFAPDGQTTSIPDVAIDRGIALGALSWKRRASISAVPYSSGATTDRLNYLKPLLDALTQDAGTGWGVNALAEVYTAIPEATPRWLASPDSGVLTVVDAKLAGAVFGRYRSSTTNRLETAQVGTGAPQIGYDMTGKGPLTQAGAQAILSNVLGGLGARRGWGNGLELTAQQITNRGGARANLALVAADGFQSMRLHGLRDERGVTLYTDIGLSETTWDVDAETIDAIPVGYVARDLGSIGEDNGLEILT